MLVAATPVRAQDADGDDGPGKPTSEITITARRLDAARANIEPSLGASTYLLTNDTVESRPSSETTTIAQILLQTPGVAQDGTGAIRLRQSAGNLQYRINNVILPDGLTDLGESLSPRIAAKVTLIKGALPAQYGLNAGGVVNVTTKDGVYLNGGQAEPYGGGPGEFEPAVEYGGSIGRTNFFGTGSYLRSDRGLPTPDDGGTPLHDRTRQLEGLAYVDRVLDQRTRVALIVGASDERFQLPNRRGQDAATADIGAITFQRPLMVNGVTRLGSEDRDDNRRDQNRYAVLSLLHTAEKLTLQLAGFVRHSASRLDAGGPGDILFTGVGMTTDASTDTHGFQVEGVYEIGEAHTLRAGATLISDINHGAGVILAVPVDASGVQTADGIITQRETARLARRKDGAFLQDEWRLGSGFTLNAGGRVDHVKGASDETRFSPRASLVWQPQGETTVHLGYARYFLPAPVEEAQERPADLAGTSARLPSAAGNAPLPETDDYLDLGAQHDVGALTVAIDGYWRNATNLIDDGVFGPAAQQVAFNYARGRVRGIEISATYNRGRLSGWANVAAATTKVEGIASNQYYFTPSQLAGAAGRWITATGAQAITVSGGVSYRFDALRFSGDILYGSGLRRTLPGGPLNGAHLPGYAQIDLSAMWRVAKLGQYPLDLRADLINAFDRRYALADGTGIGASQPQWAARRGLFVGVEQAF